MFGAMVMVAVVSLAGGPAMADRQKVGHDASLAQYTPTPTATGTPCNAGCVPPHPVPTPRKGGTLAYTGYPAGAVLAGGLALFTAGLMWRRRSRL